MKTRLGSFVVCVGFVTASLSRNAAAQDEVAADAPSGSGAPVERPSESEDELRWRWARFSLADYLVTGLGGATTLAAAIAPPHSPALVVGPVLFDEAAREALRVGGLDKRYIVRDASDVGISLAVTWPFFADSLFTAWWYRGSRDVAQEMALIDLETLAVSGAVQGVTNVLVGRERPYGGECGGGELPDRAIDCDSSFRYRSFFSGHSAFSYTGAALVCVHHLENELLGAPWDAVSCAGGYAVAATTATFRVMADVHYASDVLTGALVGTAIGYGIPLLHYARRAEADANAAVSFHVVPMGAGIGVVGGF